MSNSGATPSEATFSLDGPSEARTRPEPGPALPERYEDLGLIGRGGMGEVRRVLDRHLGRRLAMKILRQDTDDATMRLRFLMEARITAQLQHPGVVAIHDQGVLSDGRIWFTMREVQGRTLRDIIAELHAASRGGEWGQTGDDWSFRRLLLAFMATCDIVAYAHAEGVVHRDLKPRNVMVGAYSEVQVLDWGLARRAARPDDPGVLPVEGVAGSPGYMSPEQARGDMRQLAPTTDVWALGSILYEILSGVAPYPPGREGWRAVLAGPAVPLTSRVGPEHPPLPDELVALVSGAMTWDLAARPTSAAWLARGVREWLDGARRRERAMALVAQAEAERPRAERLRTEARTLRRDARSELDHVPPHAEEASRWAAWEREDRALALETEAEVADVAYAQALRSALAADPSHLAARDRLADFWRERMAAAEAAADPRAAVAAEAQLRVYDRGRHAAYLRGDGALTLLTDPPPAAARLLRFESEHRRLVPVPFRELGAGDIVALTLPRGSFLVEVQAPGCAPARIPVLVGRDEHWDGVPPGESASRRLRLPRLGELGPDDCWVPDGWFDAGGDPEAGDAAPARRYWVDGFVMRRFPVTVAEYLAFLQDLADRGEGEELARCSPRAPAGAGDEPLAEVREGRVVLRPHPSGRIYQPDWPIADLCWDAAVAYTEWAAARLGRPWRLPAELEWEKAARGVDRRRFPWGDFPDTSRANNAQARPGAPSPAPVSAFPLDESVYGVRGMAGNLRTFCIDGYRREGPPGPLGAVVPATPDEPWRNCRGGSFSSTLRGGRSAERYVARARDAVSNTGFRLTHSRW